jgi:hypothetical protein
LTSTTGGSIVFTAANGTYTYSVLSVPTGYVATPSGGQITVAGNTTQAITISQVIPGTPMIRSNNTSVPIWACAVMGLLAALTLILLVTTVMLRRRPPPPPSR